MFRTIAVFTFVFGVGLYAWKDWFKGVCGLILLMAVIEHPDMPKSMLGIQGLNPWNLLLLDVVLAWFVSRRKEGLRWDMPRHLGISLVFLLGVIVVSFGRLMLNPGTLVEDEGVLGLVSEYLINPLKFVVPGLLLFDGCRTRARFNLGLASTLGVYVLLALQVIKWVPPTTDAEELERRSRQRLRAEIGYHRVNMSTMLAGASWGIVAAVPLLSGRLKPAAYALAGTVIYAQALTAGRTGYVAWAVVGFVLSTLRWRRYLFLAPLGVLLVALFVPAVVGRFTQGLVAEDSFDDAGADETTVTGGRNLVWPFVIAKIKQQPVIGYGRQAFLRTSLGEIKTESDPEGVSNPHSAYLEMLLDNGIVGACLVLSFYGMVLVYALLAFRDSRNPIFIAAGGVASALLLAQLAGGVSAQSFYPREGTVGMWCAIGLALRVHVERKKAMNPPRPVRVARVA